MVVSINECEFKVRNLDYDTTYDGSDQHQWCWLISTVNDQLSINHFFCQMFQQETQLWPTTIVCLLSSMFHGSTTTSVKSTLFHHPVNSIQNVDLRPAKPGTMIHQHQTMKQPHPTGAWVSSVLRPHQHSIGYTGDGFYRSKDPTNSIKVLKEMLQKRKQWKQLNTHIHRQ